MLLIILDGDVFAFDEPSVIQALPKGIDNICEAGSRGASEKSDYWHRPLLRTHRERPRGRAAEQRDERAALHSITSSARASRVGGMVRRSALAVSRLTMKSNLVGCSTGMSAGLVPRRILST